MSDEKQLLIPEKLREELEAKYENIVIVPTKKGPCVFRLPKRQEYKRYQSLIWNEKTRPEAADYLVRAMVVWPELTTFDGYLEKFSAIVQTCVGPILEAAGIDTEADAKKYETGSDQT